MAHERYYIVAYDISDNFRRRQVCKTLEGYGVRRQKSLFECHLDAHHYTELLDDLASVIDAEEDNILAYSLCANCVPNVQSLGVAEPVLDEPDFYLV